MKRLVLVWSPLFFLITLAATIHLSMLGKPFIGHHDWNSVFHGQIARNNLRYGLPTTKFGQVTNAGTANPQDFAYHTHHPLLWPLLITASIAFFGIHEWAIRLVPFLSSQAMLIIYFLLIKRYFGSLYAFLSTAFLITTPMFIYFGILPDKEPLVLFLILLDILIYTSLLDRFEFSSTFQTKITKFEARNSKQYQNSNNLKSSNFRFGLPNIVSDFGFRISKLSLLFLFIIFIGGLTHWIFYFLPTVFFFYSSLTKRKLASSSLLLATPARHARLLAGVAGGCYLLLIATFSFHLWHTRLLTGDWLGGGLRETLGFRLSQNSGEGASFTLIQYLTKLATRLGNYFGWVVLPFVIIGFLTTLRQKNNYGWRKGGAPPARNVVSTDGRGTLDGSRNILMIFLAIGLIYPAVFHNYVWIHDYLLYYMLPFWGLAATLGLATCVAWLKAKKLFLWPKEVGLITISFTLILLSVINRAEIITTLRGSNWFKTGKDLGEMIRHNSLPPDQILIGSSAVAENFGRFIDFYGDRRVVYTQPAAGFDFSPYTLLVLPREIKPEKDVLKPFHFVTEVDGMRVYRRE